MLNEKRLRLNLASDFDVPENFQRRFAHGMDVKRRKIGFAASTQNTMVLVQREINRTIQRFGEGSIQLEYAQRKEKWPVRFVFPDPHARKMFYRQIMTATRDDTWRGRHGEFDTFASIILKGRREVRFLDAGSSFTADECCAPTTRDTMDRFASEGIKARAVALDKGMPEKMNGKENEGILYAKADLLDLPSLQLGEFDLIRCMNMLFYYDDRLRGQMLHGMEQSLADGGLMVEDETCHHAKAGVHWRRGAEVHSQVVSLEREDAFLVKGAMMG